MLVRDPRDQVCSARSYSRTADIASRYPHLDVSLEQHAAQWLNVYRGLVHYAPQHLLVRYEDLIARPHAETERVLHFLRLQPHFSLRDAIATNRGFAGHGTSATPIASVGRWQRDLTGAEASEIEGLCSELMQRFGYGRGADDPNR